MLFKNRIIAHSDGIVILNRLFGYRQDEPSPYLIAVSNCCTGSGVAWFQGTGTLRRSDRTLRATSLSGGRRAYPGCPCITTATCPGTAAAELFLGLLHS